MARLHAILGLICCVIAGWAWQGVHSHGFVLQPMSRSYVSFKTDPIESKDWDPMGANGGGPGVVYEYGRLHWPNGRYDLCGEAFDKPNKVLNYPRMVTGTYSAGATIDLHFVITANHQGRFELRVCPQDATASDREARCALIERADGRGPHWTLPAGELPDSHGRPLVPIFRDGSYDLYDYPGNDDFRGTPTYIIKYKLPPGFTCDKCILHWYWLTGNSCNPPCEPSDPLFPECDRNSMGYCGQPNTKAPEEFWGCSDIRIKSGTAAASILPYTVLERRGARRNATRHAAAGGDAAAHDAPTGSGVPPANADPAGAAAAHPVVTPDGGAAAAPTDPAVAPPTVVQQQQPTSEAVVPPSTLPSGPGHRRRL